MSPVRFCDSSEIIEPNATDAYINVSWLRGSVQVAKRHVVKHEDVGKRHGDLLHGGILPFCDPLTIVDKI